MIWWPRHMPRSGRPSVITCRARATGRQVGRVAGPGEKTNAIHFGCENFRIRAVWRQDPDTGAAAPQAPHDVGLEAEVDDRDQRAVLGGIAFVARGFGETWATKSWSSQRGRCGPSRGLRRDRSARARSRWRADCPSIGGGGQALVSTPAIAGIPDSRSIVASCWASSRTAAVALATIKPRNQAAPTGRRSGCGRSCR